MLLVLVIFLPALISATAFWNLRSAAGEISVISSTSSIFKLICCFASFVRKTLIASCRDEKPISDDAASAVFFNSRVNGTCKITLCISYDCYDCIGLVLDCQGVIIFP